jgi:DNA-binding response OmpR family regulator
MQSNQPDLSTPGRILIVDDEENIRRGLRAILVKDGHEVNDVGSAEGALRLLDTFSCEVAVVDIRMPGMSGVELLHEIRNRWPYVAVIMLTGHATLESAMNAIKEGAHDYLLKPAQPDAIRKSVADALISSRRQREQAQLMSSLRSSLERLGELPGTSTSPRNDRARRQINIGDLIIDPQAHQVWRKNQSISLTPSEFQLLLTLSERSGQVIDYVTLVQLSLDYIAEPWEAKELIKRHIFSLRQKIEPEPSTPIYVLNVRGVGYRMASDQELDQL